MDVFSASTELERAFLDFLFDFIQAAQDGIPLFFGKEAASCEHPDMSAASCDVIPVEPPVEAD